VQTVQNGENKRKLKRELKPETGGNLPKNAGNRRESPRNTRRYQRDEEHPEVSTGRGTPGYSTAGRITPGYSTAGRTTPGLTLSDGNTRVNTVGWEHPGYQHGRTHPGYQHGRTHPG